MYITQIFHFTTIKTLSEKLPPLPTFPLFATPPGFPDYTFTPTVSCYFPSPSCAFYFYALHFHTFTSS